jgi:hypothetical protein
MPDRGSPRSARKREALHAQGALHPRPQDVTDPLFRESTFFDAHDIVHCADRRRSAAGAG